MTETGDAPASRWPGVLGTVGVVLGILMLLDKLDDLVITARIPMRELTRLVGPETTDLIAQTLPSLGWRIGSFLVTGSLGILLVVGSVRLFRRDASGVRLCGVWAWLAIGWALVETMHAVRVVAELTKTMPVIEGVDWTGYAWIGVAAALGLMIAYPAFLVRWFARPSVRDEIAAWPAT